MAYWLRFKENRFYNREVNSPVFCAIQWMSFIPPFYVTQIINPLLISRITANHDKGRDSSLSENPKIFCAWNSKQWTLSKISFWSKVKEKMSKKKIL